MFYKHKGFFFSNNAVSVLATTMQTDQDYRLPPHQSRLLKQTLSLSAADCTHVEPDLVYVCMYVCRVCVLHDMNSIACLQGYLIEACFPTTYSVFQLL